MKKYKGKKITSLLLAGVMTFNSCFFPRQISGYQSPSKEKTHEVGEIPKPSQDSELNNLQKKLTSFDYDEFRQNLKEQFSLSSVTLDEESDEFISSIYVDGINVKIILTDGSSVEGKIKNLKLGKLHLDDLYILDTQYQKDLHYETYGDYSSLTEVYNAHDKLKIEFSPSAPISVYNNCKFSMSPNNDIEWFFWENYIDISQCENLWLNSVYIFESTLKKINSSTSLKKLFLTDAHILTDSPETLAFNLPKLQTLIFDISFLDKLYHIDLSDCVNLQKISFGNNTQIESLDFLSGLDKLKVISLGNLSELDSLNILNSFEEEENSISETFKTDDARLSLAHNNLISDISGINGKNIEVLNISLFRQISSTQLYETVISLPNLKEIVGFEINNAEMCSEELIQYCEAHGITHPFTEKSLTIKRELQRIVAELITPDMDDFKKAEVLSKYIISHQEYDYEAATVDEANFTEEEKSELLKRGWGENLYYVVIEGLGLCAGYEEFTLALFTEAEIRCFGQATTGHAYNLVEIDGIYYQIDLTWLDSFLNLVEIPVDEHIFEINSICYLTPVEDPYSHDTYSEPYGAEMQRQSNNDNILTPSDIDISSDTISNLPQSASLNTSNFRLISILRAVGIATEISRSKVQKIIYESSQSTSTTLSPFWTTDDYSEFYTSYIHQETQKIEDEIIR